MLATTIQETKITQSNDDADRTILNVLLIPDEEGGYTVTVPKLPGLITEGDTEDECIDNFFDAFREYYKSYKQENETPPIPLEKLLIIFEINE